MAFKDAAEHALDAMKAVYGPFDHLTLGEATTWVVPESPGAGGHRGRYLWTDAFGVLNFVTRGVEHQSGRDMILAKRLVQTVHDVLGRTRDGDHMLPGATREEPLKGGLRIGKNDASGYDGDGQYHHYLTIWMFALNRLSIKSGEAVYNDLAIQLAKAIQPAFVKHRASGEPHMVWKVSTDLQTVLVPSEGHLDAATGFVIYRLLQETAASQGRQQRQLQDEIVEYFEVMDRKPIMRPSGDLLDLGMGLWISHIYPADVWARSFKTRALALAEEVLAEDSPTMRRPVHRRLAFREFGACLGILCYDDDDDTDLRGIVDHLLRFWEEYVATGLEDEIRPISQVMYAAVLLRALRITQ